MVITAIIVDDVLKTVSVFSELLKVFGLNVVAQGYDGKDAVRLYKKYKPDIIL